MKNWIGSTGEHKFGWLELALSALSAFVIGFFLFILLSSSTSAMTTNELLECTNEYRIQNNVQELEPNFSLYIGARRKAFYMVKNNLWVHGHPWRFFGLYRYRMAGENLAKNYSEAQEVCDAWMDSPTHRANLLDPGFEDVGFAVKDKLVVQFLGIN